MVKFSPEESSPRKQEVRMRAKKPTPPPVVQRAIKRDDLETLRALGSAGGRIAAENKKEKKENTLAAEDHFKEQRALAEKRRLESTNEHIAPIDPEEVRDAE